MKTVAWRALAAVLAGMCAWAGAAKGDDDGWARGQAALAKEAYDKGDAAGALALWEGLAAAGVEDPHLDYDMGNALYRLGRHPEAIRMYRRAQRALPRDPDVEYNLGLAAEAAGTALPERGAVERWMGGLSRREWGWVAEGGFWALVALAAAWMAANAAWRERLRGAVGTAALVLLAGLAGVGWNAWEARRPECVVMGEGKAALSSAPLEGAAAVAEMPSGTLVRKVGEQAFWVEVSGGGAQGWLPRSIVREVD